MIAGALATLGALVIRLVGWRVEGRVPEGMMKAVVIAAPHTSNWDLPLMLAVAWVLGVRPAWLGKRELFQGPLGWVLRRLGGLPVDRAVRSNVVEQAIARFDSTERLFLVVPPSGTRARARHWKSGFYHVARGARVPILCAFLDYRRRTGGIGPALSATGNVPADMERLRGFYGGVTGKYPENATPVRLAEEEEAVA